MKRSFLEERKPVKQMASPDKLTSRANRQPHQDDATAEEISSSFDIVARWKIVSTPEKENSSLSANGMEAFSSYNPDVEKRRPEVHVEILVHPSSSNSEFQIGSLVRKAIRKTFKQLQQRSHEFPFNHSAKMVSLPELSRALTSPGSGLDRQVQEVAFESGDEEGVALSSFDDVKWQLYVYKLQNDPATEDDMGHETPAATHRILPSEEHRGLWESLVYDSDVKQKLLNYSVETVLFSKLNVDDDLVSWNKVILLHGPPGTGKTSLCKALAQKLSIRLVEHYSSVYLMEVNSHSLFSRWFSESGKLVMKMFQSMEEVVKQNSSLVILLIDEVESLTRARQASISGNEPSDALRAVNALLTQIDKIKRYPNVLILTTSNLSQAIDLAFVDRADIKQYIGNPSQAAREAILLSSISELIKRGVLGSDPSLLLPESSDSRSLLTAAAKATHEFSGRALRKLPFLTKALKFPGNIGIPVTDFLRGMVTMAREQRSDAESLKSSKSPSNGS
ncbi:hypothetical protein RvY_00294 [Ramazzottius varieornatus]|uniref:AAA+ ATPase domain-containing protein n=1 Tax=Ramazzottius varieornatus TaxID=947166 RepID=A0A1D1UMS3_RAMVA|nr:hypothetical protein RvY_00294 [Ramazzottius varieornatus]